MNQPDITRNKHRGSPTSATANQIASEQRKAKLERIEKLIDDAGPNGLMLYEVVEQTGWLVQSVSSLLSWLKKEERVVELKETAEKGGRIYTYYATRKSPTGAPCKVLVTPRHVQAAQLTAQRAMQAEVPDVVATVEKPWGIEIDMEELPDRIGEMVEYQDPRNGVVYTAKFVAFSRNSLLVERTPLGKKKSERIEVYPQKARWA